MVSLAGTNKGALIGDCRTFRGPFMCDNSLPLSGWAGCEAYAMSDIEAKAPDGKDSEAVFYLHSFYGCAVRWYALSAAVCACFGFRSIPISWRFKSRAVTSVEPEPQNESSTISPSLRPGPRRVPFAAPHRRSASPTTWRRRWTPPGAS